MDYSIFEHKVARNYMLAGAAYSTLGLPIISAALMHPAEAWPFKVTGAVAEIIGLYCLNNARKEDKIRRSEIQDSIDELVGTSD